MMQQNRLKNILKGGLVYPAGDSLASLLSGRYALGRMLGVALIGASIYAFEVPWIFKQIQAYSEKQTRFKSADWLRTGLAIAYFNPRWIARHIFFLRLLSGQNPWNLPDLLLSGLISFLFNLPISLAGNYLIQVKLPLRHRFLSSAIFSGIMALNYALLEVWLHA